MGVNNLNPYINFSQYLTGVAKRYQSQKFNGLMLAPTAPVNLKQGTYTVMGQEYRRADGDLRAIGAEAKQLHYSKGTDTYSCDFHSKKVPIYLDANNSGIGQSIQDMRENATFVLMESLQLEREREIAALATATASYTVGSTTNYGGVSVAKWDQSTTSVMADIAAAMAKIRATSGNIPNKIFIPAAVQFKMATQAPFSTMLGQFGFGANGFTPYGLPKVIPQFGLEIVTLDAVYDSAGYGGSNVTISDVWGDNVILAYVDENWMSKGSTFMTTFAYQDEQGGGSDVNVFEYLEEAKSINWIEGKQWRDVKVVDPLSGYMITDVLT